MHKYYVKINGVPGDYAALPFGRQCEFRPAIEAFRARAKRGYIGCKRRTVAAGFREFRQLTAPTEWYFVDRTGPGWKDDAVEIWYVPGAKA